MSYYYRGNLAVELESKKATYKKQQRKIKVKSSIPTGEKLLYLLFIILVVAGVGFIGSRYILLSQYNYQIQSIKMDIKAVNESNTLLQMKIEQMSSRDRILNEAGQMGMAPSKDSVRVISGDRGIGKK